jgi:integrase
VHNLAARAWRHPNGLTWLQTAPLITIERNRAARRAYPLSWEEQDLLFSELPAFNREMARFKVNTGTRDQEVCALQWSWEIEVKALGGSVFLIPGEFVKNREDRLVVLNHEARSVVEAMRGRHAQHVFAYQRPRTRRETVYESPPVPPRPVATMHNSAWQNARREAAKKYREVLGRDAPWGFANVRIHDLKHTFGRRLRAAGVPEETRAVLLGHKTRSMPTHYSVAELAELVGAANRIDRTLATPAITLLRAAA